MPSPKYRLTSRVIRVTKRVILRVTTRPPIMDPFRATKRVTLRATIRPTIVDPFLIFGIGEFYKELKTTETETLNPQPKNPQPKNPKP